MQEDLPTDSAELPLRTDRLHADEPTSASCSSAGTERAPPPRLDGRVLRERYMLERRIGTGNMGQIYQALDSRRQEAGDPQPRVALKIVNPAWQAHSQSREALHQEAMLARTLAHANIVRIHDFDRDGELSFLVMEWLDGESLARFLDLRQRRPVARPHALKVIEAVARALAHAHAQGIVHADIKPGNIFLCGNGEVKLLDFGIARSSQDEANGAPVRGHTPEYASCEVLEGEPPGPVDDLFSLGCVAYRMLAGRRPFGHETALEAESAGHRPAVIDHLPAQQWQALDQALAFRRADRHPDINQFIAALKGPRPEHFAEARGVAGPRGEDRLAAAEESPGTDGLTDSAWQDPGEAGGWRLPAAAVLLGLLALGTLLGWPRPGQDSTLPDAVGSALPEQAPLPVASRHDPLPALEISPPPRKPDPVASQVPRIALEPLALPRVRAVAVPARDTPRRMTEEAVTGHQEPFVPMSALRLRRYAEPDFFPTDGTGPDGWVDISFVIDTRGLPHSVRIIDGGQGEIAPETIIAAVSSWRFQPVAIDGEVTAVRSEVRLHFAPDRQAVGL
ncbi:MAG: protein kinase [Chromatiales bacterium]|nr:protein kinase [Chromatiales bacterium]